MRPKIPVVAVCLASLVAVVPCAHATDRPAPGKPAIACDGNEKNLQTYLRIHDVLFMERDASRVGEFYAPEVISHNLDSGGGGEQRVKSSDLAAMWAASKQHNPERVLADDLIICQGPYVVVRTTMHSSDTTGFAGNAPTGKSYSISAIDIYRFENGKVVERWGNSDLISLFRQIGYTLKPPESVRPKPAAE
jgi:predicted ester cyclase